MEDRPTAFSRKKPAMLLGVRIGVCSDVHGRHDRLVAVLGAMAAAGVDERWCLGDLVGEPVTPELVGAARQLDLLIAGNHDAWALGPDRVTARGRDAFRLASRAMASRHGIDWWLIVDIDARVLRWQREELWSKVDCRCRLAVVFTTGSGSRSWP